MKRQEQNPICSRVLMSTSTEKQYLKFIFQTILKTEKAPTVKEISLAFKNSDDHAIDVLDSLERNDLLLRKCGTQEIMSIYPFSLVPTEHRIVLENGTTLFAMCAIDALGMPVTFCENVMIISRCEKCKQKITVEIKNEKMTYLSHPNIVIWSPEQLRVPAAETCCPSVNFFCCEEHLEEWVKENPSLTGRSTEIQKGFPRIKQSWKLYGETLGFR